MTQNQTADSWPDPGQRLHPLTQIIEKMYTWCRNNHCRNGKPDKRIVELYELAREITSAENNASLDAAIKKIK